MNAAESLQALGGMEVTEVGWTARDQVALLLRLHATPRLERLKLHLKIRTLLV